MKINRAKSIQIIKEKGFECFSIPYVTDSSLESIKRINVSAVMNNPRSQAKSGTVSATGFPLGPIKIAYYRIKDILSKGPYSGKYNISNASGRMKIMKIEPDDAKSLRFSLVKERINLLFIAYAENDEYFFESETNGSAQVKEILVPGKVLLLKPNLEGFKFNIGKSDTAKSNLIVLHIQFSKDFDLREIS